MTSNIETIDEINDYILSLISGDKNEHWSSDLVERSDIVHNTPLETITGLPNHNIKLKNGTPIMLLRNLDQSEGLCNWGI